MNDNWDVRWLNTARYFAMWSKDPSTRCGAVIVDERRLVSQGYNGFAAGTDDSPERYADRDYKLENVIHCEENAIIQATEPLHDYSMYLTGAGCSRCTARVIQTGISTVVIPCREEDAFAYRADWNKSFEMASAQLETAKVSLHILGETGFDARDLMGPLHPYWDGRSHEYFQRFDRK